MLLVVVDIAVAIGGVVAVIATVVILTSSNSNDVNDGRIFDLFGREYYNRLTLKTGVYIQNKRLFFIEKSL